jgi:hypothetical protein
LSSASVGRSGRGRLSGAAAVAKLTGTSVAPRPLLLGGGGGGDASTAAAATTTAASATLAAASISSGVGGGGGGGKGALVPRRQNTENPLFEGTIRIPKVNVTINSLPFY